jgi:hypothetical protein
MDPDGERKKKVTIEVNEDGIITKTTVQTINYSLKSQMRKTGNDWFSGDAVITYDYYDTVDLVLVVKNANGKVLSTHTQNDIISDIRVKGATFTPKSVLEASDAAEDFAMSISTTDNDPLMGNSKGHFKGGIDFTIDDDGSILNIRGLDKINSSPNPRVVEISALYAIMAGQTGAPSNDKLTDLIGNISKNLEQNENVMKETQKVTLEIIDTYYATYTNSYSGKKSVVERVSVPKDTTVTKGNESKANNIVNKRNEKRKTAEERKIKS